MKRKLRHFAWLLNRVRDMLHERAPFYIHIPGTFGNVKVPTGAFIMIIPDAETYGKLIDALADAKTFTGIDYTEILNETTLICNP